MPEQGVIALQYFDYRDWQPGADRMTVRSPSLYVLRPLSDDVTLEGNLVYDSMSGASPLAFNTREVELVRPMLVDASRNWGLLQPDFSQRLLLVFRIMKEKYGYDMALLEGYRSPARQDMLAGMGTSVTNARAFQSWHQYGLAADCAFWREGRLVISEKDPWAMRGYQLYGEVAESLGLTWGGRWAMMDLGHTELRMRGVMRH